MTSLFLMRSALLVACLVGGALYHWELWPFSTASSLNDQEQAAIEALVSTTSADVSQAAPTACVEALAQSRGDDLDDDSEADCIIAEAVLPDADAQSLLTSVIQQSQGALAMTFALENAAHLDTADAWLKAARQLRAAAGPAESDFAQLDPQMAAAAHGAAVRAVRAGSPDAAALVQALESVEFPLKGAPYEPLWRSIYFGRYKEVTDSPQIRHVVAGMAFALSDLCAQWEPPGIRSVEFDTTLESYLAPLRAQVPARLAGALPRIGGVLTQSIGDAYDKAGERSAEAWMAAGMRTFQRIRKELQNGVALGAVGGRDAAQMLYNQVQSCRSPRGEKFIRNLTGLLRYTVEAEQTQASQEATRAQNNQEK